MDVWHDAKSAVGGEEVKEMQAWSAIGLDAGESIGLREREKMDGRLLSRICVCI
jgi:hypothetical protein